MQDEATRTVSAEPNASNGRPKKKQREEAADLAWMREKKEKDPGAAKSERFPALALSRSGSKGISHPRHTDNPTNRLRCAAQDPRVSSRNNTPRRSVLATICNVLA
jgi:hypothetical protein